MHVHNARAHAFTLHMLNARTVVTPFITVFLFLVNVCHERVTDRKPTVFITLQLNYVRSVFENGISSSHVDVMSRVLLLAHVVTS